MAADRLVEGLWDEALAQVRGTLTAHPAQVTSAALLATDFMFLNARARRLVAASGTRGAAVKVWTDTDNARFGKYCVRLLDRLGYDAGLRVVAAGFPYIRAVADSRNHAQIGMYGWVADFPDPAACFDPVFSCHGRVTKSGENLNRSQLCDSVLDRLAAAAAATNGPGATHAWVRAARRLDALAPAVPLRSRRKTLFSSPRAGNVRQSAFLGPLLEQAWLR